MKKQKYVLLRHSKTNQSIWTTTAAANRYLSRPIYLTDHSGDGMYDREIGRPDQTDDGPLRVERPAAGIYSLPDKLLFTVRVHVERTGEMSSVWIDLPVAMALSLEFNVPVYIKSNKATYLIQKA